MVLSVPSWSGLRWWLILWLATLSLPASEKAVSPISKPETRTAIATTIEAQLAALRDGDWRAAYRSASRAFRAAVGLEDFAVRIERRYPQLLRSTGMEVLLCRDNGTRAEVSVRVFGADDEKAEFDYVLVKEPAGWRVHGVLPKGRAPADGLAPDGRRA